MSVHFQYGKVVHADVGGSGFHGVRYGYSHRRGLIRGASEVAERYGLALLSVTCS